MSDTPRTPEQHATAAQQIEVTIAIVFAIIIGIIVLFAPR